MIRTIKFKMLLLIALCLGLGALGDRKSVV